MLSCQRSRTFVRQAIGIGCLGRLVGDVGFRSRGAFECLSGDHMSRLSGLETICGDKSAKESRPGTPMVPARTVMKIANTSSADSEDLENNDTADSNKAIKNALQDEARSHFGTKTIEVGFL